jgi:hypothetical protein
MTLQTTKALLLAASVTAMVAMPHASLAAPRPVFGERPIFGPPTVVTAPGVPKPVFKPAPTLPEVNWPGPKLPRRGPYRNL